MFTNPDNTGRRAGGAFASISLPRRCGSVGFYVYVCVYVYEDAGRARRADRSGHRP